MTTNATIPPHELEFVRLARVARLATIGRNGLPSLVPVCFAIVGDDATIVSVLDEKPKHVPDRELARVRNVHRDPRVRLLVDHYEEDWSRLGFVQIAGMARVVEPGTPEHNAAVAALREKYPQYREMAIESRTVIAIDRLRTHSWGLD